MPQYIPCPECTLWKRRPDIGGKQNEYGDCGAEPPKSVVVGGKTYWALPVVHESRGGCHFAKREAQEE